jgi:hypothetical protein
VRGADVDQVRAQASLQRALARLQVVGRVRRRGGRPRPTPTGVSEAGISADQ